MRGGWAEDALADALASLRCAPAPVVTDSQAFAQVAAIVPAEIPLTGFSILMSRWKGDLAELRARRPRDWRLEARRPRPHHRRLYPPPHHRRHRPRKTPRWLNQHVGGDLAITNSQGRDWPADLASFKLIVHCGACMWNRREMLSRILLAREAGVPITNFGMAIAWSLGVFERALGAFGEIPASR
ncbi:MAG: hypothetical protein IPG61_17455 [bacterium]|nr:hypothetical protein [bacterium]